MNDRSDFIRT